MPKALHKVQKQISKKRGGRPPNNLHENSRDAQRLRAAGAREEKLARIFDAATRQNRVHVDRIRWFKAALEGSSGPLSDEEMHVLTASFIAREDEELEELKAARRPGRPSAKAEERILERKDGEEKEFKGGFWVPELRSVEGREKLERWAGEWAGLNSVLFVRVVRDGEIKKSSFPPKGLS